ncbi:MAG: hypothetical protein WD076_05475, partial [Parvularculaceae bacterium]
VSGVPAFQPGEQDILFIRSNGEDGCALVLCEYGRYRVLEGGVYNPHGFPVRAVDKNNIIARGAPPMAFRQFSYPAPKFDDLMRNPAVQEMLKKQGMSEADARARYESEAPKQITLSAEIPETGAQSMDAAGKVKPTLQRQPRLKQLDDKPQLQQQPGATGQLQRQVTPSTAQIDPKGAVATTRDDLPEGPLAVEAFVERAQAMLNAATRKPADIKSFDLAAQIRVAGPILRQPAAADPGAAPSQEMSPADRAEMEALQKQDFNPVLKRQ